MGASQRKEKVEEFTKWATETTAPDEDDFMESIGAQCKEITSGVEFYSCARPIAQTLVENAKYNNRIHWLLNLAAKHMKGIADGRCAGTVPQIALLWGTELILRHVLRIVGGHSHDLLQLIELPSGDAEVQNAGIDLCAHLLRYTTTAKLDTLTVTTHLVCVRLLLTMTSSALHHGTQFDETKVDIFTESILSAKEVDQLVNVLLRRLVHWGTSTPPPMPTLYSSENSQPSFFNFFGFFGGSAAVANAEVEGGAPIYTYASCGAFEMVGRLSSQLLCILLAHQKGNGKNTVLSNIKNIKNGSPVAYTNLLQAIAAKLTSCPTLCLLLYSLFYDHESFLHDIVHSDVGALLDVSQQILHLLYRVSQEIETGGRRVGNHKSDGSVIVSIDADPININVLQDVIHDALQFSYPFTNFMASTLLFILSQDQLVNRVLCDAVVVPNFTMGKPLENTSIGSLGLNILSLNVSRAFTEQNDSLVNVLIPSMVNLALFVHDMDRTSSQRVVALLCLVIRKIRRVDEQHKETSKVTAEALLPSGVAAGTVEGVVDEKGNKDPEELMMEGERYLRQLALVAEVVSKLMGPGDERHNQLLIYELLYSRTKIIDVLEGDSIGSFSEKARETLANLTLQIKNYETDVSASNAKTPAEIIAFIGSEQSGNNVEMVELGEKSAPLELAYTFDEMPNSYNFFGPFVWSTMLFSAQRPGGILFSMSPLELQLFNL